MKFTLDDGAVKPSYAKFGDAGMDISSLQDTFIPAGGYAIVRTGVSVEIPTGHYGALVGRSGMASKGIIAHFGTIDSGFRGSLGVILFNMNATQFDIKKGDRIAQLIIHEYVTVGLMEVDHLSKSERGSNGFGSTGTN